MKKKMVIILIIVLILIIAGIIFWNNYNSNDEIIYEQGDAGNMVIQVSNDITRIENGFSYVRYDGNYYFDEFINQGGASSDADVVRFLMNNLQLGDANLNFQSNLFGCSTLQTQNSEGQYLFGRNFDWNNCDALIVLSKPSNGYESISTVNMDFVTSASRAISLLPDSTKAMVSLYAPLDGMNEEGLTVAVNMIQDSDTIEQNTEKPDITTTTAVRLLLNNASTVEEAIQILESYDVHASMGYMVHFAISDRNGRSVVVEYINNEMQVIDTKIVTNFYLAEGEKYGIGTQQSHTRYEILQNTLAENSTMNEEQVRDALSSVSKRNFGEFESTEWSIVFNQETLEATYYHRENYDKSYTFKIGE